jgi:hypothetical protein
MKEILEAHKGPFTEGHLGLYEILTTLACSISY